MNADATEQTEADYERAMNLPAGKRCADCAHFRRCAWLIGADGTETACDWYPSRFRALL
jgi:hypothetical protein